MSNIGIVMATHWEAAGILKAFGFKKLGKGLYQASVKDRIIYMCISGVGQEAARQAADRLCALGVGELVSAGFCGALVPELRVGDLVTDRLATSSTPVRSAKERQAITSRANAVAVDMETQAVVEAGTRRGVPIRVCRIVSDGIEDDLTPLFGSDAAFIPWRMAIRLLNPGVWPLAHRLRQNSRIAEKQLISNLRDYFR